MNSPKNIDSESLLSILFHSPNATAVYQGEDIKIMTANLAMLNFWGKDRSVVGKNLQDAVPELKGQPFVDILKGVWYSGETYIAKNCSAFLQKDGVLQEFFFDFEYKAILDENGKTAYILHTASEVSERMHALKLAGEKSLAEKNLNEKLLAINEEFKVVNADLLSKNEELITSEDNLHKLFSLLHEQQQLFRIMIEQSPVAMATLKGPDFIVDVVNQHILDIWGKDRSVLGRRLAEALPELKDQQFLDILKNVYETDEPFYGKELKALLTVDGETLERYLNFVYQPTNGLSKEEKLILIVATDVTEQVNSRRAINEINTRLEIAMDASRLGSTEVQLATGKMQSTDRFKMNYGFMPEEDFCYSDLFEAMYPEYRDRVKELVQEAIRTNGIYSTEYPVKWRDGSTHWIQAHGRPRYNDLGVADRMVGMTLDITDRKLFEQQKDDFLSIVSHELRTPITVLKASLQYLELLKDKPYSNIHSKMINQSLRSVEKMNDLVAELLQIRRLTEGQLEIKKDWFNMFDLLLRTCDHVCFENEYQLVVSGNQTARVYADEHRIDQVVINFVNNAIKYAPMSKEVHLNVEVLENQSVKVSVRDFGIGIEQEALPKLFDRYYRVSHSGKEYSGLGLGLYICSEIIRKHDGKIGAESVLNEGSTFWFILPDRKSSE
ncbi:ATP-binding protein [Sphingobacterium sp. 2149]|uniref:PAS domain-containing sensor histidine kinase n=1 Tax=Sphingobacterium sp. 2149 TaxID=2817763 RepID=UPI001AE3ED3E|nr:ATP-binding protein [Sphingobacterium sp. 2149]MDR6736671.1 PAS domain S-box-containing protein [Sphingobacterium sp. 2149]